MNTQDIAQCLAQLCRSVFGEVLTYRYEPGFKQLRFIGDVGLSAYEILSQLELPAHEQVLIKRCLAIAEEKVYDENRIFYFISFWEAPQALNDPNFYKVQHHFARTNLETLGMRLKIRTFKLGFGGIGGSTDDYFFERMPRLIESLKTIFSQRNKGLYSTALYNLCNLHQTLQEYLESGHEAYKDTISKRLKVIAAVLGYALKIDEVQEFVNSNVQLSLFIESQRRYYRQPISESPNIDTLKVDFNTLEYTPALWSLTSLAIINKALFLEKFEAMYPRIVNNLDTLKSMEKSIAIRVLLEYLKIQSIREMPEMNFRVSFKVLDRPLPLKDIFHGYSQIARTSISNPELQILQQMPDDQLRQAVAQIIQGVDPVVLQREARKPHGGFEIADMELPIRIGEQEMRLCLPFKSGKEIKQDVVSEQYAYQIFRPFLHFTYCAVVFITAKRCSQNLENYIKRMRDQLGWSIDIIQEAELAKLLKINNLL